jgi:hypothetical protein
VHLCLLALFIAYFPFTAMAHAMLKYFTYHWIRWDDRPAARTPEVSDRMRRYLAYPVHWSAPHIRSELGANWAETLMTDHKERRGALKAVSEGQSIEENKTKRFQ